MLKKQQHKRVRIQQQQSRELQEARAKKDHYDAGGFPEVPDFGGRHRGVMEDPGNFVATRRF